MAGPKRGVKEMKLQLSLACGDSDLNRALVEGIVRPDGIELIAQTMPSPERHRRMLKHEEFDVCEFSLSTYLLAHEAKRPFIAIPVFPHRRFRHSYVFCRSDARIETPTDLTGKRIGLDTLQNTAGLWMRGILQDYYGVPFQSIRWWTQEEEDIPVKPSTALSVERVPPGTDLDAMLCRGDLEAVIYPEVLPSVAKGSSQVRRLFTDPKQAEMEYYRRTGIFPIMHTVVTHARILERHPWVPANLLKAFRLAKEHAYVHLEDPRRVALVWVRELLEEQRSVMGPDPWPYNLADNRLALETLIRYSFEQGLLKRKPRVEELFVASCLEKPPRYI